MNSILPSQGLSWYAIHVKSNQERTVTSTLSQKGFETFLPVMTETRTYGSRRKEFQVPCFKGYLFSKFESNERRHILVTPNVFGIVGIGKTPEPVPDVEIAALRHLTSSGVPIERCSYLATGDHVVIRYGPLAGLEGLLTHSKNAQRVVVSITLLRRSVSAEVDVADLSASRPQRAMSTGAGWVEADSAQ